ncbi:PREDICTED: heat shock factor 2-binding protein-like [Dinoponera quadriceps]|uniref:Heat shock factor 2-binding protein-like n=1 Tax=Dinoponera quadriceps TaxID=609295 RepID=A0A6P3Y410_DINQU|nr:PREDICTED: heat shock factor 2-binding protein-like [Dinoponera quadriceps]
MDEFSFENDQELFNSLETILSSTERNFHEFIDDIPNILVTNNFECKFKNEETNGDKIHMLFNKFSTSSLQSKLGEFLSIVDGTFSAFVNTYKISLPPTNNVEYKFIIGLLGIVTNLSASPEGREFLITNFSGREFVRKIIQLISELPSDSGSSPLKRLMLMVLYNVSVNKTGLQYLLESRVGDSLSHCLRDKSTVEEMQLLCLRVLQSVTYDLTEPRYIQDLNAAIPIDMIETIACSKRDNLSDIAKQVIEHLRNYEQNCKVTSQDV